MGRPHYSWNPPCRALDLGAHRHACGVAALEIVAGTSPDGEPPTELPWTAYIGAVYAARQLASDALDTEAEPDLVALGDELEIWLADLFGER